jgi:hypothetical protein
LPTSPSLDWGNTFKWPNWRDAEDSHLRKRLDRPLDGILFDVAHNDFWLESWGFKPVDTLEALKVAESNVRGAPVLIPIYANRFLPADPSLVGNPVFSVEQTDIIYYGFDLPTFFHIEFHVPLPSEVSIEPRRIELWTELTDRNRAGNWNWWDKRNP